VTQLLLNWFEERAGDVPPPLRDRLRAIVGTIDNADTIAQQVLQLELLVAMQLDRIRECQCTERRDALDLLTADALVSYVLEFAAPLGPEPLDELTGRLMHLAAGSAVSSASGTT
jgi:hypothetical protein